MISSQREILNSKETSYLSIGITPEGAPRRSVAVPWESTSHAFNMRIPDVYIAPEDLDDTDVMEKILSRKVIGCYIWAPLSDYKFLTRLKDLQDIYIANGDAISDLAFLQELTECRMFYLQNAKLKNLDTLVEAKKHSTAPFGGLRCVGLDNCAVEDLSIFERETVQFSEFLIWKPEGSDEKSRWNVIRAHTRRYYEYREK